MGSDSHSITVSLWKFVEIQYLQLFELKNGLISLTRLKVSSLSDKIGHNIHENTCKLQNDGLLSGIKKVIIRMGNFHTYKGSDV